MLATGNNTSYIRQVMGSGDQNLIRQVMDANTKSPGEANCPFIVNERFIPFQLPTEDGGKKTVTGLALTAINSSNFDKIDLVDIINSGRFANVITINGKIAEINVHPDMMKKIDESDAFEVLIAKKDGGYSWPKENPSIGIGAVSTNEVYHGMVRCHGFGNFIRA